MVSHSTAPHHAADALTKRWIKLLIQFTGWRLDTQHVSQAGGWRQAAGGRFWFNFIPKLNSRLPTPSESSQGHMFTQHASQSRQIFFFSAVQPLLKQRSAMKFAHMNVAEGPHSGPSLSVVSNSMAPHHAADAVLRAPLTELGYGWLVCGWRIKLLIPLLNTVGIAFHLNDFGKKHTHFLPFFRKFQP
jgi:hypothetical protein